MLSSRALLLDTEATATPAAISCLRPNPNNPLFPVVWEFAAATVSSLMDCEKASNEV